MAHFVSFSSLLPAVCGLFFVYAAESGTTVGFPS
ncbi:protein of unknown function [Burkholderia multivorans]